MGIDFTNGFVVKLHADVEKKRVKDVEYLLLDGEKALYSFEGIRDYAVFTTLRLIIVNVQGITGSRQGFISLPYSHIQVFSVQTAGTIDLDSEIELFFSGLGRIQLDFSKSTDIREIGSYLSKVSLTKDLLNSLEIQKNLLGVKKDILEIQKKQDQEALNLQEEQRNLEYERVNRKAAYWALNLDLKNTLDSNLEQINHRIEAITYELNNNSEFQKYSELSNTVKMLETKFNSLGVLSGRERKIIEEQLIPLKNEYTLLSDLIPKRRDLLQKEIEELQQKKQEIVKQLTIEF